MIKKQISNLKLSDSNNSSDNNNSTRSNDDNQIINYKNSNFKSVNKHQTKKQLLEKVKQSQAVIQFLQQKIQELSSSKSQSQFDQSLDNSSFLDSIKEMNYQSELIKELQKLRNEKDIQIEAHYNAFQTIQDEFLESQRIIVKQREKEKQLQEELLNQKQYFEQLIKEKDLAILQQKQQISLQKQEDVQFNLYEEIKGKKDQLLIQNNALLEQIEMMTSTMIELQNKNNYLLFRNQQFDGIIKNVNQLLDHSSLTRNNDLESSIDSESLKDYLKQNSINKQIDQSITNSIESLYLGSNQQEFWMNFNYTAIKKCIGQDNKHWRKYISNFQEYHSQLMKKYSFQNQL